MAQKAKTRVRRCIELTTDPSAFSYHRQLILKPLNGKFKETIMMGVTSALTRTSSPDSRLACHVISFRVVSHLALLLVLLSSLNQFSLWTLWSIRFLLHGVRSFPTPHVPKTE